MENSNNDFQRRMDAFGLDVTARTHENPPAGARRTTTPFTAQPQTTSILRGNNMVDTRRTGFVRSIRCRAE
eukprot:CAMPEP_0116829978 /NCGR_PEP_ID=MMETSP0418-20121206/4511_1 /TAXON_ID=1158023 /ORGANISM="Astrosyne radiata, Strain 13vi08-1A" /LENGTH=70 /DNA_ID=CAMNT_0004459037 /DNA_START=209 /DNA_END=418 /DNA_ORIENTATION=+